jgi:putative 4-mercaptohistidine N1-methyltranferase
MIANNFYETDRALAEYLLFHYGDPQELLPPSFKFLAALNFPTRCVTECLDGRRLPAKPRGLDLGCAVGRATFELARQCTEVLGLDYSDRFVTISNHLRKNGSFLFGCVEEGDLTHPCQAVVPPDIDRERVRFERGDAMHLSPDLTGFDVVLMANLIDRLSDPRRCLDALPRLLNRGGQLIITSPYTWMAEYTPKENWLGGYEHGGKRHRTLNTLKEILSPDFQFSESKDLPFLIREHSRKFQLGIAEASIWTRI